MNGKVPALAVSPKTTLWNAGRGMGWFQKLLGGPVGRTTGYPTSSNRASSFHLRWGGIPNGEVVVAVSAVLTVVVPPAVPDLHFWALQASFVDGTRRFGAGHLGLQWYPRHPGSTAVNWGGYRQGGGELGGSPSTLPSATGNPNTRDLAWAPNVPYRLEIATGASPGDWRGRVDGLPVRDLHAGGRALADVVVWSEVFARCDDPSSAVRWSGFEARTADGRIVRPDRVTVNYQRHADGGCANTDVRSSADGLVQMTSTDRMTPQGATLPVEA
jgi:hypothetical protein